MIFTSRPLRILPTVCERCSIDASRGVIVMPGDDSVMPYAIVISGRCMSVITRRINGSGHNEPAITPVRSDVRSYFLKSGCSSSAMNMVGTPYSAVQRSVCTISSTRFASNASTTQRHAPCVYAPSTPITQPKQWKSGTHTQRRSAGV